MKYIIVFLFISISIFSSAIADEIHCVISVQSDYENFSKRLEKKIKDQMDSDVSMNFSKEAPLINSKHQYRINLTYPVYPFKDKASLYIKFNDRNNVTRYLAISHHTVEKANLSISQQEVLINKVSEILIQQLKIESGYLEGLSMKPGYYTNHQVLSLNQTLDIKLIEIQNKKSSDLIGYVQRTKEYKNKTTMRTEQDLKTNHYKKPLTLKQKFDKTKMDLGLEIEPQKISQLYLDLSSIYEVSQNKTKALEFAQKSYDTFSNHDSLDKVRELQGGEESNKINRFRLMNKKRKLKILANFKVEHDDNVIQEAVDAFVHTDTVDTSFQGTLSIDKAWGFKFGLLDNSTSYSLKQSNYAKHKDLDLSQHRLGHAFSSSWDNGSGHTMFSMGGGYIYFSRHLEELLRGQDANIGVAHYMKPHKLLFSSDFSFLDTKYSNNFFNSDEMSGQTTIISSTVQKTLGKGSRHKASLTAHYRTERPGRDYLSNDAYRLVSKWEYKPTYFIDSASFSYLFERQEYNAVDPQGDLRKDDKITVSLECLKTYKDYLFFNGAYKFTDNQSNLRVKRYIRQQISFSFGILF